jgi:hypothetical protein
MFPGDLIHFAGLRQLAKPLESGDGISGRHIENAGRWWRRNTSIGLFQCCQYSLYEEKIGVRFSCPDNLPGV